VAEAGERLDKVERRLGSVETGLREVREEVGSLRTEVGGLRTDVGGLRTEVGGLRTEVGGLRTEVGGLRTDVGDLRTEMGDVRGEVLALRIQGEQNTADIKVIAEVQAHHGKKLEEITKALEPLAGIDSFIKLVAHDHEQRIQALERHSGIHD